MDAVFPVEYFRIIFSWLRQFFVLTFRVFGFVPLAFRSIHTPVQHVQPRFIRKFSQFLHTVREINPVQQSGLQAVTSPPKVPQNHFKPVFHLIAVFTAAIFLPFTRWKQILSLAAEVRGSEPRGRSVKRARQRLPPDVQPLREVSVNKTYFNMKWIVIAGEVAKFQ